MEKYWALDLTFVKAKGTIKHDDPYLQDSPSFYVKQRKFRGYKLNNYLKSKTIEKNTVSDIFQRSGEPYKYLEIKQRFIIPSEVIISKIETEHTSSSEFGLIEKSKTRSDVRYVVNEKKMILEPVEIIYYMHNSSQPYINTYSCFFYEVNSKTLIICDKSRNLYRYYHVSDDCENDDDCCNLYCEEAKRKIEKEVKENVLVVTPVENIETEFQTV